MVDIEDQGIRPQIDESKCDHCQDCLSICPGYNYGTEQKDPPEDGRSSDPRLGPVLSIWEGFACDQKLRFSASSGGAVSAIASHCLEEEGMEFVLHIEMEHERPWRNETAVSKNREEIYSRVGSRYSPSAPCKDLDLIENSEGPCVFIGKPCDAAALSLLRKKRKELDEKIGLVVTFFCAGTPCSRATIDMLKLEGVRLDDAKEVHYRGDGWPGEFRVSRKSAEREIKKPYLDTWRFINRYRSMRCHLCPDGMGYFSDISCGDAWHVYDPGGDDTGKSIVIARTKRGAEIVENARSKEAVYLKPLNASSVMMAQKSMLAKNDELFGRLFMFKLLMIPHPRYPGHPLLKNWLELTARKKLKTLFGTVFRILTRGLWHRTGLER